MQDEKEKAKEQQKEELRRLKNIKRKVSYCAIHIILKSGRRKINDLDTIADKMLKIFVKLVLLDLTLSTKCSSHLPRRGPLVESHSRCISDIHPFDRKLKHASAKLVSSLAQLSIASLKSM